MRFLGLLLSCAACGGAPAPAPAPPAATAKILVNVDADGIGLGGNDPVAYATDHAAIAGGDVRAAHGGATYRFATPEHAESFRATPATYAPQYGGYCAFAASQGRLSPSDPAVFLIHDGQLLVFTNADFLERFQADPAGNKAKADANWPALVAEHGK